LPHTLAHHAVAHPAGAFFVALVLLYFLRMLHHCWVIGILLSPRRYPAADQSECDGRQHEKDAFPFFGLFRFKAVSFRGYRDWSRCDLLRTRETPENARMMRSE
jgi:hypothetical protein